MNLWGQVKQAASAGILAGGYPYTKNFWYVGSNAPVVAGRRADTIADALLLMENFDVLFLGPQRYSEGALSITKPCTIIGQGNRGDAYIQPSTAAQVGVDVLSDDVTFINVGVADGGSGAYGLKVGAASTSPDRFRAYGCKFEGSAIGAWFTGSGDCLLDDCEFAWAAIGLQLSANLSGFVTEMFIQRCRFHNNATANLSQSANQQEVDNLSLLDSSFERDESGVAPTKFINLQHNSNHGVISGNRFANATNQAAVITIGTGLLYMANATEAGWSTARPA